MCIFKDARATHKAVHTCLRTRRAGGAPTEGVCSWLSCRAIPGNTQSRRGGVQVEVAGRVTAALLLIASLDLTKQCYCHGMRKLGVGREAMRVSGGEYKSYASGYNGRVRARIPVSKSIS